MKVTKKQKTDLPAAEFEQRLRKYCNINKLRFVSYDKEKEEFIFVSNFV